MKIFFITILFLLFSCSYSFSQRYRGNPDYTQYLDSLEHRIVLLRSKVEDMKKVRSPQLYHIKKDLEFTEFSKQYRQYILNEDPEKAFDMAEKSIESAKRRKDKNSVVFYTNYKDDAVMEVKLHKMYYQNLFKDEKNFIKEYNRILKNGTEASFKEADSFLNFALKYATENNFPATIELIKKHMLELKYKVFDSKLEYNLAILTKKDKEFFSVFVPLVKSDSITDLLKADSLVRNCYEYSKYMKTALDTAFFGRQLNRATNAINDYYIKADIKKGMQSMKNQAIVVKRDSLNPTGIFKWFNNIVVINYFTPSSSYEGVRKGEAILHADKFLSKYIEANELGVLNQGDKMGKTAFIPYLVNGQDQTFYFHEPKNQWQYMAVYTMISSPEFTESVRKYLPPMQLEEELNKKE